MNLDFQGDLIGDLVTKSQILAVEINSRLQRTQAEVEFVQSITTLCTTILRQAQQTATKPEAQPQAASTPGPESKPAPKPAIIPGASTTSDLQSQIKDLQSQIKELKSGAKQSETVS